MPDVADLCRTPAGPVDSAGCPDTDRDGILDLKRHAARRSPALAANGCADRPATSKVVALLDGKRVSSTTVMTRHGRYDVSGSVAARRGEHTLKLVWYSGSAVVQRTSRTVTVGQSRRP